MQRRDVLALLAAGAAATAAPSWAESYPERSIKIYQGFGPGGNADAIARAVAAELGKTLGQPVVVEAHTGAGGTIAAGTVARAKPDGYTLLLATGGHAVAGALYHSLPYKTVSDFEPVSTITYVPFLVVVHADAAYRGFADVLQAARTKQDGVSYGSAGVGSTHHLAGELLSKMGKAPMLHLPYRGDAASLTAVLSGEIPFIIVPPTSVMSNIQAGKLRALASTGPRRWPGLPNVPTVAEQGVPGYDVRSWAGLLAPAGTPRPIVDHINAETEKALQVASVRQRLEDMGGEVRASTPGEMKTMIARELERWTLLVAESKIPK